MKAKMKNLGLFLSRDAQKKTVGGDGVQVPTDVIGDGCTNACEDDRGCLLGGKCAKGTDGCMHCYSQ